MSDTVLVRSLVTGRTEQRPAIDNGLAVSVRFTRYIGGEEYFIDFYKVTGKPINAKWLSVIEIEPII